MVPCAQVPGFSLIPASLPPLAFPTLLKKRPPSPGSACGLVYLKGKFVCIYNMTWPWQCSPLFLQFEQGIPSTQDRSFPLRTLTALRISSLFCLLLIAGFFRVHRRAQVSPISNTPTTANTVIPQPLKNRPISLLPSQPNCSIERDSTFSLFSPLILCKTKQEKFLSEGKIKIRKYVSLLRIEPDFILPC